MWIEKLDSGKFIALAAMLIMCVGLVSYSNSLTGDLVMDDGWVITGNNLEKYLDSLDPYLTQRSPRSLTNLTFALNYALHGTDTFGYHVVNLVIHLTNSVLVVVLANLILQQISGTKHLRKDIGLIAGLIFVSHPIQTMAVSYITQRYASLVTLVYLVAMCVYFFTRQIPRLKYWGLLGVGILFVIGLAAKETIITLPAVLLVSEYIFYRQTWRRINWPLIGGSVIGGLILLWLALRIYPLTFVVGPKLTSLGETVTWYQYALTQFRVLLMYVYKIIIPVRLNADYYFPISQSPWEWAVWVGIGFWLSLWALASRLLKTQPVISWGICWFLLTLLTSSSVLPLSDVINEYRVYLPMVGISILAGYLLVKSLPERSVNLFLVVAALISCYAVLTFNRNFVYQNSLTYWRDVTLKSPQKPRGFVNYGMELHAQGDYAEAVTAYQKTLELDPQRLTALSNMGVILAQAGEYDAAFIYFNKALGIDPNYIDALNGLGILALNQGDATQAANYFERILEIDPQNSVAQKNLNLVKQVN